MKKLAWALFFLFLTACSSLDAIDTSTPEGAYKLAQKLADDGRYEEAIMQYRAVRNKFPYSKLATEAELAIADVNYHREAYIEAQNAYEVFKELHPRHPKSDYVTFRLGMSYFNQLPSTLDRDLTLADRAILYFDEVIRSYPNSEFVKQAQEHKTKALQMLAGKEYYIGNFYYIREKFDSALLRFQHLLENYSGLGYDEKALLGAAVSAAELKDTQKAKQYYDQLAERFPNSDEFAKAKSEIGDVIQ